MIKDIIYFIAIAIILLGFNSLYTTYKLRKLENELLKIKERSRYD